MRNVIVTGGSRGLGLAIVRRLAEGGHKVLAVARKISDPLEEAIGQAERSGRGAIRFLALDLENVDAIPEFTRELRKEHGPVYGLVNNAGIGTGGLLATMHNSEIERLIRLNTLSPIILTKYVVRAMMADREGRVVNMASIVASNGFNALSVYSATKASLIGFTRSLAREAGALGVTVNAVAPGFIDTEMTATLAEGDRDKIARRSAMRRLAEAADVASAVEFLLGDGARNITGTVMTVDAGTTA